MQPPTGKAALAATLVAYAGLLAYAILAGWQSATFVWTLWLSGIVAILVAALLEPFFAVPRRLVELREEGAAVLLPRAVGEALGTAFLELVIVAVAVGPIAFGSLGTMLNAYQPLLPSGSLSARGGGWFNVWVLFGEAGARFWPFAAVLCAMRAWTLRAALGGPPAHSFLEGVKYVELFRAVVIVALALLVHIVIGAWSSTTATLANYLLLAGFLFPWRTGVDACARAK